MQDSSLGPGCYFERCVTDAINRGDPLIYDELMRVLPRTR